MTQLASFFRKISGLEQRSKSLESRYAKTALQDRPAERGAKSRAPSPLRKRQPTKRPDPLPIPEEPLFKEVTPSEKPNAAKNDFVANIAAKLSIPCPDPTGEERIRDEHQNKALKLVRQEDWAKLSKLIAAADAENAMTPGGMNVAELLSFGARADVVLAVEHALLDRTPEQDAPLMMGIEALEFVLAEHAHDYVIGCIVAQAHMDMAWAWRGIGWDVEIAPRNREAFEAHFARAREIVQSFKGKPETSALLASTSCALQRGADCTSKTVADRYEALIDLNPENTSPLRALGTHMLPRWYGSYDALELEARRTAARTQQTWGAGGYTWVMFDAISVDDEACARLDLPFFIEGLRDIVNHRPEPHTVNLLAAYCANTIGQAFSGNDAADANRALIAECADWIVREHLTELHPMIWAHAAQGFANNLRVASASRFAAAGQEDALRIIAGLFKREIAAGQRIVFTDQGPTSVAT
ncbi:hypothetical protein [Sulfitobacter donghicola]|uniref:Uncharacterized protein n=1 Tax=Sulfitobacter donghicola DSW-25 = KCTC 12864 = JCM 14565 TaxID=1300350 RepID=A0A073IGA7_9RHOB|nr:hypothetical protein [Sulfitobacter donghicola]KEJ89378.1 hypothetical protein DSW25_10225 [Sulfitobacter donghicola DSW-25 = KCTC 12864 = JCM 14565]KIN69193.1 hypothetical protein Z948_2932 [Sulfitobacter donghicola DSW-25 = KCTC 12864 = JCM 14565]